MDRPVIYTGEQGRSTDFLFGMRSAMVGLAKLSSALLGVNTLARGLACTPTSPASMQVNVGPGELYALANIDGTAYGTLPADTTHQVLKQGILLDAVALSCPAPITSGFSINYLIEAAYQESDTTNVVLPYFNSANPSIPLNGPGGLGTPNATERQGLVTLQAKAGTAATTGTQTTPAPDAGFIGLFVVTVAFGASTITAGNISQYAAAPFITNILQMLQTGSAVYAVDTSAAANTITLALTPPITSYSDGQPIRFKAANTNTGAVTLNAGGGAIALTGMNGALQGGEIVALKQYEAIYSAATGTAILIGQTAGPLQVAPATQSQHAVQMAQAAGVVGSTRNLAMSVTAASTTATLTADEIIVETALGGVRYCLPSFSKTINLATTGAGGMDTGSAPVSGYVAIYAIYNPTTATSALLATNATAAAQPNVYGGANMPAGYTASALVSVWPTNASSQFLVGSQFDRAVNFAANGVASGVTTSGLTSFSLAGAVPKNAKRAGGSLSITLSTTGIASITMFTQSATGASSVLASASVATSGGNSSNFSQFPILTAQTAWYVVSATSGTVSGWNISVTQYDF